MDQYAIWDLDNCLSNDEARIKLIDWSASNPASRYAAYHQACDQDQPGNLSLFGRMRAVSKPVFFTARPLAVREKTVHWIENVLHCKDYILMMRNNGDHRTSVLLKEDMLQTLFHVHNVPAKNIVGAYDDREDIVKMYIAHGLPAHQMTIHETCAYTQPSVRIHADNTPTVATPQKTAADILASMADTYRERNKVYGDNFKMVAKLMAVLFPNGVPSELVVQDQFHLFELVLVKLSRYAISNLTHIDSAHDAAVYFAMCEAINQQNLKETK